MRKISLYSLLLALCLAAALPLRAAAAGGPRLTVSSRDAAAVQTVGFSGLGSDCRSIQATFTLSDPDGTYAFETSQALLDLAGAYVTAAQDGARVTVYATTKSGVLTTDGTLVLGTLSASGTPFTVEEAAGLKLLGTDYSETTYDTVSLDGATGGVTTWPITIRESANGTVTASHSRAARGLAVTLTAQAAQGYALDTLTVTDSSGRALVLTSKGSGRFSFAMPSSAVTVSAAFVPAAAGGESGGLPFADVAEDAWYHDAVAYVYDQGLMAGTSGSTFAPALTTSRAMVVTTLWRLAGAPEHSAAPSFTDVAADAWYTGAVAWASENGIVTGYSHSVFAPEDTVTREQLAVMLYRYVQFTGGGFQGAWAFPLDYADARQVSDWAYEALCWCTMKGIINGVGGNSLNPQGSATRAEVAQILMNFSTAALA